MSIVRIDAESCTCRGSRSLLAPLIEIYIDENALLSAAKDGLASFTDVGRTMIHQPRELYCWAHVMPHPVRNLS